MREFSLMAGPAPCTSSVAALAQALAARLNDRLEADLLIAHVLEVERSWLYAHGELELSPRQKEQLQTLAQRRERGEPIAYLLGCREFYGRGFQVSPAVLIPRPETELLVECTLQQVTAKRATVVDVGTGSGCIALTLAAERPDWRLAAVDLSADALAICRDNAERLGLSAVELFQGDLLAPVKDRRFDAIVSNPPYVAAGDPHLARGDLRFEPDLALSAGRHGLDVIRRLLAQARHCLRPRGWLLIEHGYDQGPALRQLYTDAGFQEVATRTDLADIERVTLGLLP